MNEKDYYKSRIAYYVVMAFIIGVLAFLPGIDAVGRTIMGSLAGFLLILVAWNVWKMRSAPLDSVVYTPLTLHNAPLEAQIIYFQRARWILPLLIFGLTAMTAWEFHQLDSGAVKSVKVIMPFNWLYSWFGSGVAISAMAFSAVVSYALMEFTIKLLRKQTMVQTSANQSLPPSPQ